MLLYLSQYLTTHFSPVAVNIPEAQYNLDCMTLRDFASLLDAGVKYSNRELVCSL